MMQPRLFADYAANPSPRERAAARAWNCAGQMDMFAADAEPAPPSCAVCAGQHATDACTIGTAPSLPEYVTVRVPPVFLADHIDRGCVTESGEITKGSDTGAAGILIAGTFGTRDRKPSRTVTVRLHPNDVRDLMSDAEHYASSVQDYGRDFFGLCSSARATVIALMKQGVPRCNPRYYIKGAE